MSNREFQDRKLKPHQRKIWIDAFKASMSHVSIEAAERKAWQAVDICERVGAFHESTQSEIGLHKPKVDLELAWNFLRETLQGCAEGSNDWEDRIATAMLDYMKRDIPLDEFKEAIDSILRDPNE